MLTVLIRDKKTGREIIYPADEVEFQKGDGLRFHRPNQTGAHCPESKAEDGFRDVFVMNAEGQTVARYIL